MVFGVIIGEPSLLKIGKFKNSIIREVLYQPQPVFAFIIKPEIVSPNFLRIIF